MAEPKIWLASKDGVRDRREQLYMFLFLFYKASFETGQLLDPGKEGSGWLTMLELSTISLPANPLSKKRLKQPCSIGPLNQQSVSKQL